MPDNSVTVIGNVTRDPELRFTASGQATATFGIAVNRRWMNRQTNEWQEAVSFLNVVCWREQAENAAESLHKGTRVIVTGRLKQRSYDNRDGQKVTVIEMDVDDVGPALRTATAKVNKVARAGGGGFGGDGGGFGGQPAAAGNDDPWASNAPAAGGAPAGGGNWGGGGGGASYDEPPF